MANDGAQCVVKDIGGFRMRSGRKGARGGWRFRKLNQFPDTLSSNLAGRFGHEHSRGDVDVTASCRQYFQKLILFGFGQSAIPQVDTYQATIHHSLGNTIEVQRAVLDVELFKFRMRQQRCQGELLAPY